MVHSSFLGHVYNTEKKYLIARLYCRQAQFLIAKKLNIYVWKIFVCPKLLKPKEMWEIAIFEWIEIKLVSWLIPFVNTKQKTNQKGQMIVEISWEDSQGVGGRSIFFINKTFSFRK